MDNENGDESDEMLKRIMANVLDIIIYISLVYDSNFATDLFKEIVSWLATTKPQLSPQHFSLASLHFSLDSPLSSFHPWLSKRIKQVTLAAYYQTNLHPFTHLGSKTFHHMYLLVTVPTILYTQKSMIFKCFCLMPRNVLGQVHYKTFISLGIFQLLWTYLYHRLIPQNVRFKCKFIAQLMKTMPLNFVIGILR